MNRFLIVLACGLLSSTMAFADGGKTGANDTGVKGGFDTGVKAGLDNPAKVRSDTGTKAGQDTGRASVDTGVKGTEGASSARLNSARTARRPRG